MALETLYITNKIESDLVLKVGVSYGWQCV